ncbi:hypothetical protein ACHAWF_019030 [Thalassiosira exigua]
MVQVVPRHFSGEGSGVGRRLRRRLRRRPGGLGSRAVGGVVSRQGGYPPPFGPRALRRRGRRSGSCRVLFEKSDLARAAGRLEDVPPKADAASRNAIWPSAELISVQGTTTLSGAAPRRSPTSPLTWAPPPLVGGVRDAGGAASVVPQENRDAPPPPPLPAGPAPDAAPPPLPAHFFTRPTMVAADLPSRNPLMVPNGPRCQTKKTSPITCHLHADRHSSSAHDRLAPTASNDDRAFRRDFCAAQRRKFHSSKRRERPGEALRRNCRRCRRRESSRRRSRAFSASSAPVPDDSDDVVADRRAGATSTPSPRPGVAPRDGGPSSNPAKPTCLRKIQWWAYWSSPSSSSVATTSPPSHEDRAVRPFTRSAVSAAAACSPDIAPSRSFDSRSGGGRSRRKCCGTRRVGEVGDELVGSSSRAGRERSVSARECGPRPFATPSPDRGRARGCGWPFVVGTPRRRDRSRSRSWFMSPEMTRRGHEPARKGGRGRGRGGRRGRASGRRGERRRAGAPSPRQLWRRRHDGLAGAATRRGGNGRAAWRRR